MDEISRHSSGMLWALQFAGGVAAELATPVVDVQGLPEDDWTWLHLPLGDVRARSFLAHCAAAPEGFRQIVAEQEDRIRLHGAGGWLYGVLPDFERDLAGKPLGPGRLFFACDARRLITGRLHALRAIDDVRHAAEHRATIARPVLAIAAQLEAFAEIMEDRLDSLTDQIGAMEDLVLSDRTDLGGAALGPVRREMARHRRELGALRSALLRGRMGRQPHPLAEDLGVALHPVEDLDREFAGLQDRGRLLNEEIDTLLNSATNKSMRTLTVMSTLLIPPTLVVGAFGMNLPGMPFEHTQAGFAAASLICVATVVGALILLRRMDMLS